MKRFFVCFAVFAAMLLMISCGSSSKTGDNTDTGEGVTDEDSDSTDSVNDLGDTVPDNNEPSDPTDDTDTSDPTDDADSGDSKPDSENEEPVNENPDNLPECSPTSATPCYDSTSHLTWSKKSVDNMTYDVAMTYCSGSEMQGYGGFSKLGDSGGTWNIGTFWSSSLTTTPDFAWDVDFGVGSVLYNQIDNKFYVRCVRNAD